MFYAALEYIAINMQIFLKKSMSVLRSGDAEGSSLCFSHCVKSPQNDVDAEGSKQKRTAEDIQS